MSSHRLDTAKLLRAVDRARGAGTAQEISYRQIAGAVGVRSSLFSRLARGERPAADALCSLIMWLDPLTPLSTYVVVSSPSSAHRPAGPAAGAREKTRS